MPNSEFIVPLCSEEIAIHYQDDALMVVDKPAGLLSVPGRHPQNKDCLISRLQADKPEARIVHRLDMATSGLMIIALSAESHRQLSRQFEQRKIGKRYLAKVDGKVEAESGFIDLPLACDWPNRPKQHINFDWGKSAQTHYRRIAFNDTDSVLELEPITGRSHQLRVHCASIGHPILGCEFYATDAARSASPRLLLHASQLNFRHPQSNEIMDFASPAPFLNL
ncbi:RluA family pseudouridine synthase [Spongiibacter sp. KMU-158]|uniref:Pseudouridine synthase n=1 Tax=Spongiibacter pelagi TaxID=2760804 RepID=A0A927C497_9GAMM|nr:RluA family pseudouridine synthase [Spongiibacter pelagi]MBD2859587.1 RluA family pseudouridine synthase [Spongiibacter pelagi]